MAAQVRQRHCLTSIKVQIVSGLRLAWRSDMVSQPPVNILSTATADPANKLSKIWMITNYSIPGIERISWANQDKQENWAWHPAYYWSELHELKFSWGRLKYVWTSSMSGCDIFQYLDVKSTFWGESEGANEGPDEVDWESVIVS